jgi:hypothetical protein
LLSYCDLRFRTVLFGRGMLAEPLSSGRDNPRAFLGTSGPFGELSLRNRKESETCTFDVTHLQLHFETE